MNLSMNERAAALVDGLVADAGALGIEVRTLDSGARLVDCGAEARGGLQAGLGFAAVCMGGLGRVDPVPVAVGERTWPGVGVSVDQPAAACLGSQYAGWKLEDGDFFAMASGPGRALARAEDLFEELAWRERAKEAGLCLETRQDPPADIVEKVTERCGVDASAVSFLIAPTASVCGSVSSRSAPAWSRPRCHKLHELERRPARVRHGWGCCPIAPVARRSGARSADQRRGLYGGTVHLWIDGADDEIAELARRLPSSASDAFGTPFGDLLQAETGTFTTSTRCCSAPLGRPSTSTESGRAHHGGHAPDVLERSFTQ